MTLTKTVRRGGGCGGVEWGGVNNLVVNRITDVANLVDTSQSVTWCFTPSTVTTGRVLTHTKSLLYIYIYIYIYIYYIYIYSP